MAEPEVVSASSAPPVRRRKMKSIGVLAYLRDRWRSEVLHQTGSGDDRWLGRQPAIRRSHSQPTHKSAAEPTTRWRSLHRRPPSPPVRPYEHRDVGVQCTIIHWNALTRRPELMSDFRSPVDEAEFSSQEISRAAKSRRRSHLRSRLMRSRLRFRRRRSRRRRDLVSDLVANLVAGVLVAGDLV